jgi:hypothetical protein
MMNLEVQMTSYVKTATQIFSIDNLSQNALTIVNDFIHDKSECSWHQHLFYNYLVNPDESETMRKAAGELTELEENWYNIPDLMERLRVGGKCGRPSFARLRVDNTVYVIAAFPLGRLVKSYFLHDTDDEGNIVDFGNGRFGKNANVPIDDPKNSPETGYSEAGGVVISKRGHYNICDL